MTYRIGADVGGTFTDIVLVHEPSGSLHFEKVLTTPHQPDDAIIDGISRAMAARAVDPQDVKHVVHGTTLFTNALIERKGAKTALITTRGFRDAIEIGMEHRYDMYDLFLKRPEPLAPRHHRYEISERVLADGAVRQTPDEAEIRALIDMLVSEGIQAVGVSLIHSYANGAHEALVGQLLAEHAPGLEVTLSSDLVPEIREYHRTSTTLANVYVKAIAQRYLGRLKQRLRDELGIVNDLFIMQSNGGICGVDQAADHPILCVESGPAAGALAAKTYGQLVGADDVLSFDMGGTTAKACVIANGAPLITSEFEVDRQYLFKKGSGLPVKVPVIEMIEIGTGGGSIAAVDAMSRLTVGPKSAGSDPGPVAYGQGGSRPTITDADLLLGYLDPDFFLGGKMDLNLHGAEAAIRDQIAVPLGLEPLAAAAGIHQMANENMASAARIHAIERGKDVRKFPVFAFGGAGPVHAFGVANILRAPRVIYPLGAGVMSAVGFLTAPLSLSFVRSAPSPLDATDWDMVNGLIEEMKAEGQDALRAVAGDALSYQVFADMRYQKQGYEVRTPLAAAPFSGASVPDIKARFEAAYREIYQNTMNAPIEVVSWRLVASGPVPEFNIRADGKEGNAEAARKGTRDIYLPDQRARVAVPVYDRYKLGVGAAFEGPAIIEEEESTVVINGAAKISVDAWLNLIADLGDTNTGDQA